MRAFLGVALLVTVLVSSAFADDWISDKNGAYYLPSNMTTIQSNNRQLERYRKWHWYELNDNQYAKFVATLKGVTASKEVKVECDNADCRPLAEDIVDALNEAGWKAHLLSHCFLYRDIPIGTGLSCDGAFLCAALTSATGIKTKAYEGPPAVFTLVFGPKK